MITVIGASCIDIIAQNVSPDVFNTGHEYADSIQMSFGGDGLNEAIILGKMHDNVEFITTIGNDEAGKSIYNFCLNNNVNIIPAYKNRTYMANILVDSSGKRNLIGTIDGSLRELELNDIKDINGDIVSFASMFISKKMSKQDYETLFTRIKNEDKILCVDATTIKNNETVDEYKNVLNKIDYFLPNDIEAMLFTRCDNLIDASEVLFNVGIKNVIIKCGDKGCYLRNDKYSQYIETTAVKAIDTTGAGDSFVASFIHMLNLKKDLIDCLNYANKCALKAVQVVGASNWL